MTTYEGNLFLSEGKQGKVIKIEVEKRIGQQGSLTTCLRQALDSEFETPVGIGGPFVHLGGKVKYHIMPDFSTCLLKSDDEVANWLTFHEFVGMNMIPSSKGIDIWFQDHL